VRRVREDFRWNDYYLKAGEPVFCAIMAANRDPSVFDNPDELDLRRNPNRHLGFGWGMHFCLGAQLARLEARIAIPRIIKRLPKLRLSVAAEELSYHPTIVGRTLRSLPVRAD
jgi:cytochrome P450